MAKWITLQETAEKCGIRKGTLCMWRNRNKFPFKTKGTGRSLLIDPASVEAWMEENKEEIASGKHKPRKPLDAKKPAKVAKKTAKKAAKKAAKKVKKKVAKKAGKKRGRKPGRPAGKKRGRKPGRPAGKKRGRKPGRPADRVVALGGCRIVVAGDLDLGALQTFVADIRSGAQVKASPSSEGYVLTAVK